MYQLLTFFPLIIVNVAVDIDKQFLSIEKYRLFSPLFPNSFLTNIRGMETKRSTQLTKIFDWLSSQKPPSKIS